MATAESDCYSGPITAHIRRTYFINPDYEHFERLNRAANTLVWFVSGRRVETVECGYGDQCSHYAEY